MDNVISMLIPYLIAYLAAMFILLLFFFQRKSKSSNLQPFIKLDESKLNCVIRFLKSRTAKNNKSFTKWEIDNYLYELNINNSYLDEAIKKISKGYRILWGQHETDPYLVIDKF